MNIILAGTGSVASIKYWRLMLELQKLGEVKGILTEKAFHFARLATTQEVLNKSLLQRVVTEQDEWNWNKIGDPIPHIDLRDWVDVLVIAPLSANTLTKMAIGICDNLLTSLYYAWDMNKKIIIAPAMNTYMWENPLTREHLKTLRERHVVAKRQQVIKDVDCYNPNISWQVLTQSLPDPVESNLIVADPVESNLACGVRGVGAMAPLDLIVQKVKEYNDD
jgi:phosphopantothenoylcysteine synthetase/decarboxylase